MSKLNLPPLSILLRRLLLEDWSLKFISALLAILMWVYIDGELTDVRQVVIPLRPADITLPEGWDTAPGRPMPRVNVLLRGPRRRLSLVNAEMIQFRQKITVEQPVSGRNTLRIPTDALSAEGFDVVGVQPLYESDIGVELAQIVSQSGPKGQTLRMKLPVRPLPPAGAAMKVDPAEVEVEVSASGNGEQSGDLVRNVVLVAEWPAQWGLDETGNALQPATVPVRALAPSQFVITGLDGGPLPSVQARGAWVPGLKK